MRRKVYKGLNTPYNMKNKTLKVKENTHEEIMLFKIKSKAKNIDEVIQKAIKKLKEVEGK